MHEYPKTLKSFTGKRVVVRNEAEEKRLLSDGVRVLGGCYVALVLMLIGLVYLAFA